MGLAPKSVPKKGAKKDAKIGVSYTIFVFYFVRPERPECRLVPIRRVADSHPTPLTGSVGGSWRGGQLPQTSSRSQVVR